jgi:hypothetical protein|tara:strand:+ start:274 stop:549 length:276 start_codon:yes stop_codon:yes gene_type:complete
LIRRGGVIYKRGFASLSLSSFWVKSAGCFRGTPALLSKSSLSLIIKRNKDTGGYGFYIKSKGMGLPNKKLKVGIINKSLTLAGKKPTLRAF